VNALIRHIFFISLLCGPSIYSIAQSVGKDSLPEKITGIASYYAQKFEGKKTASGALFRHDKLTAACNKLPLGTKVRVKNLSNGKTVVVLVNDRLAPKNKRIIDLTRAAARKLDMLGDGLVKVELVVIKRP
jgi:rare lipoprotein A